MTARRRYRDRKYAFGKQILTLRTRAGLTQHALAQQVGVHVRSVQNWEVGESYPRAEALQRLIAVFMDHQVFAYGNEREEAEALWELVSNDGPHALAIFDSVWFAQLIADHTVSSSTPTSDHEVRANGTAFALESQLAQVYGKSQEHRTGSSGALYGRERQLATLQQWVVEDLCRVVVLVGSSGMGKSHLARTAAQRFAPHFDLVVSHSLHNQPPLNQILDQTIRSLSDPQTVIPGQWSDKIALLVQLLRERRCLVVFDHFEAILQTNSLSGAYNAGYSDYGTLLARLSVRDHQSCLLLASRTLPAELGLLRGQNRPIHSLSLAGIDSRACDMILQQRAVVATADDAERLIERLNGNPLALHLASASLQEAYAGSIGAFLANTLNSFDSLLNTLCSRLTVLEHSILRWLAIERRAVSVDGLLANLVETATHKEVVKALEALYSRRLIENDEDQSSFTLQPAVLEWVTQQISEIAMHEITAGQPNVLCSHALVLATAEEQIRLAQERLIAAPLLQRLAVVCGSQDAAEQRLLRMLEGWRNQPHEQHGYGPGNVVNLLRLQRGDLRDLDMRFLLIRQAYLQGVDTHSPNLAGSTLQEAIFADRLWQTWRGW